MTSALLAHRRALLSSIARVHAAHEDLGLLEGRVGPILTLLLGCIEDTTGAETLDALEAIFEEHDDAIPRSVAEAFAELTNAAHALGQHASSSRKSNRTSALRFNDGVTIDTSGELRIIALRDGHYVVGNGLCYPCSSREEAEEVLADFKDPSRIDRRYAKRSKPRVKLVGQDGNAFAILGQCRDAANKARWRVEQWEQFEAKATAGDYDHLLRVTMEHFEVE